MLVQLLTHTPEPEQVVAAAARLCYSASSIDQLLEKSRSDQEALLEKILALGTFRSWSTPPSPSASRGSAAPVRISWCATGWPPIPSRASVTFRTRSVRRRHSPFDRRAAGAREAFRGLLDEIHQVYRELLDAGIPAEDARFVLPNAAATKMVLTMNARELLHFFNLRCCRRAQWEIRAMAKEMLRLARRAAPLLFAEAGPGCLKGACPEGAMTLRRHRRSAQEYKELS